MEKVVVFGGSGFIGRRVVKHLVENGFHAIVPTRRRERVKDEFIVLPNTDVVMCDPHQPKAIATLLAEADIVINLVGILHERGRHTFEAIHVEFVRRLADALGQARHVRQFIHFSALNAMTGAPSRYLRSKGKGEVHVTKIGSCEWTVIRPSVVFGEGDSFLSLLTELMRWLPVMALPGAAARFQPIWVDDLARMTIACIHNPQCFGKALNAGGPETLRFAEILANLIAASGRRRYVIRLSGGMSRMLAFMMELIPFMPPLLTRDNLDSMKLPATCESSNHAKELVPGRLTALRDHLAATGHRLPPGARYSDFRHIARRR